MPLRFKFSIPSVLAHPVRLLPLTFMALIVAGAGLLTMPISHNTDAADAVQPALFTSVSAVTITGLSAVDTGSYWTPFGLVVIVLLVEIGGLGIMTIATMLAMFVGGRLGLRTRMATQTDLHIVNFGEVAPLMRRIVVMMLLFQGLTAVVLTFRFRAEYFADWATSAWHGLFYSVMAFNNAGFSLEEDSLARYGGDALLILPICIAVYAGAMGFPVMAELFNRWKHPRRWSIHTRLTVWGTSGLFVVGALAFFAIEWNNPATLAPLGSWDKLITTIEAGIMPRSAGLASFDWGEVKIETLGITSIMMFIGGGSASTAGGIKVTTFLLLAYVIFAEMRGDPEVMVGRRSIGKDTIRQAIAIALLAVMLVVVGTLSILILSDFQMDEVIFEVTSAFGTTGLSTGITSAMPISGQWVLMILMFIGRVGTVTAASALTLRRRTPRYHLPEERPIIG